MSLLSCNHVNCLEPWQRRTSSARILHECGVPVIPFQWCDGNAGSARRARRPHTLGMCRLAEHSASGIPALSGAKPASAIAKVFLSHHTSILKSFGQ